MGFFERRNSEKAIERKREIVYHVANFQNSNYSISHFPLSEWKFIDNMMTLHKLTMPIKIPIRRNYIVFLYGALDPPSIRLIED